MSNAHSPNTIPFTVSHFQQCARRAFDFLVSDYGFADGVVDRVGHEWYFNYRKKVVSVTVVCEGGNPSVQLNWCDHPNVGPPVIGYCYLHCLTPQFVSPKLPRLPSVSAGMNLDAFLEAFANSLRIQADYLVQNGQQFLRGDYAQVAENAAASRERWKAAHKDDFP